MVDSLKGAGRIYVQSVVDCHSCNAFGQRYISKQPVTVVHVFNVDVFFFGEHSARIETIISKKEREFCSCSD